MTSRPTDLLARLILILSLAVSPLLAQNDQLPGGDVSDEAKEEDEVLFSDETEDEFGLKQVEMLATVIELIRQNYHDEDQISYEQLINSALEGMLANLDPHCQ
ncbi:MAG: hypothetical protein AAGH89_13760, partial [Verrucomicrobiota bacterium]